MKYKVGDLVRIKTWEEMKKEFLAEMNITESATDKIIRLSHDSLGLVFFFTASSKEVRAWSIIKNCSILKAARTIHQDMEKGFIRAEVIPWNELLKHGSIQASKEQAAVRLEGKHYSIQDGDIIQFRFAK